MQAKMYTGRVIQRDGRMHDVVFREGKRYWMDNDKNWYWKDTGIKTGNPKGESFPRIQLYTLKPLSAKPTMIGAAYPFKGKVQAHKGMPGWKNLRETKNRWIDEQGNRYKKDGGWSANYEADKLRLKIDTIQPR